MGSSRMEDTLLDIAEAADQVFLAYAVAMSSAQGLEGDLVTLGLATGVCELGGTSPCELEDLDSHLSTKTMGQLLFFLKKNGYLDQTSHSEWFKAIKIRNQLAHSFFVENVEKMLTVEGCEKLADELQEIDQFLEHVQNEVRLTLPQVIAALGLDAAEVNETYVRECNKILEGNRY